ncbi:MAG: SO_0444 family Cu/Zn efflux transporter [Planctomycetota bacterium]|nr:SO_0444 family Cu/Zn efflux transporter [Planctomycetota bacterium]
METLQAILHELVALFADTAPWLLVGFVLAGVMKVFVPEKWIQSHLGGTGAWPVLRASLYGVPIPLCSCSVIPTAASLRKAGASKGATTSFLISTPETGVDSISVTYALLDPLMTVIRPVVAFVTAVVTGLGVNLLGRLGWDREGIGLGAEDGHASHDHAEDSCCDSNDKPKGKLREVLDFAFVTLLDDLTPWLLVGFVLSALVAGLVPDSFFIESVPAGLPSMLLMMLVATPIYICATASTPIAAAMIAKGLHPGAALVFLLVGPATNMTTLLVVSKLLGRRCLMVYLGGIVLTALAAGLLVDALYARLDMDLSAIVASALGEEPGMLGLVAGGVLALLMAVSLVRIVRARSGKTA